MKKIMLLAVSAMMMVGCAVLMLAACGVAGRPPEPPGGIFYEVRRNGLALSFTTMFYDSIIKVSGTCDGGDEYLVKNTIIFLGNEDEFHFGDIKTEEFHFNLENGDIYYRKDSYNCKADSPIDRDFGPLNVTYFDIPPESPIQVSSTKSCDQKHDVRGRLVRIGARKDLLEFKIDGNWLDEFLFNPEKGEFYYQPNGIKECFYLSIPERW